MPIALNAAPSSVTGQYLETVPFPFLERRTQHQPPATSTPLPWMDGLDARHDRTQAGCYCRAHDCCWPSPMSYIDPESACQPMAVLLEGITLGSCGGW